MLKSLKRLGTSAKKISNGLDLLEGFKNGKTGGERLQEAGKMIASIMGGM